MELVYLWVEDYKNIEKQGFNFSPKFNCHYDGKTLTIDDNPDHIENFFGDNINVTAIVGKNGSGKSSVLELITFSLEESYPKKIIIVYNSGNTLYYVSNMKIDASIPKKESIKNSRFYIYTSDKTSSYVEKSNMTHKISFDLSNIGNMLSNSYIQKKDFKLTTFMYIPSIMSIELIDLEEKFTNAYNIEYKENYANVNPFSEGTQYIKTAEEDYQEQIDLPFKQKEEQEEKTRLKNLKDNLLKAFETAESDFHKFLLIEYMKGRTEISDYTKLSDVDELWSECFSKYFIDEKDFDKYFIKSKEQRNISLLSSKAKDIYFSQYKEYFNLDFIDAKGRSFNDLSHGEKMIFLQFISIYYEVLNNTEENFIFLFDEPELSLHPNWQKKYILELHNLLLKLNKKFHFIFSSHSPFLLSDLTRQNIIFLDTDEEGNCKVVDGLKDKKQTFGANIHTLLSDSFFMEDGLMGEFAKGKIDKIIRFLNGENKFIDFPIEQIEKIINTIGEPFLKSKLLDMYNRRFIDDYKIREQKRIDEQIRILQEKREKLND